MKVEKRLCWGECVLPLVPQKLDLFNVGDAEGFEGQDHLDFLLLSVKSHASWIPQALGLPHEWWKKYQKEVPFIE